MSVRRLAPSELQPAGFAFTPENLTFAQREIAKYPPGRQFSAVIAIMWRAQEQCGGWLPEAAIRVVGDMLGMAHIRALEIATFYTMFQLNPVGKKAHVQVCGTTPCRLRGAGELIEVCQNRIHHEPFHLSADGDFSWEEVECAGTCVNAPMVQIWKDTYEDLTPDSLNKVLDGFASGNPPKPGPQIERQNAAPVTGPTTLKTGGINVTQGDNEGPALTDTEAKKTGAAANVQERPAPNPPAADASKKTPP